MHTLLVTRRTVPLDRSDEYTAAWQMLAVAVHARGGHAWLFRRNGRDDQLVEFLEWRGAEVLVDEEAIADARRALDELAPGTHETLEEAEL